MKLAPLNYILGVSAGFHDASITLINSDGKIEFAGHSERYSKLKNDPDLHPALLEEVCDYYIDTIAYYERPWLKQLRRLRSGEGIDWHNITVNQVIHNQLGTWYRHPARRVVNYNHHLSHAAAGFQTSPFDRATVIVIDAIGEFDTISIYGAEYVNGQAKYKKLWGQKYPHSIGLFYSAMTEQVGLKPMEEEYILMGMSAYGSSVSSVAMSQSLVENVDRVEFKENLHIGSSYNFKEHYDNEDIAAGAQHLCEQLIYTVIERARDFGFSTNLVYQGGVALNCLANRNLGNYFENIWIMPNPGDSGSSLGAAALAYGGPVKFNHAYLGHEISGDYPVNAVLDGLLRDKIVGVASGRAEFGPRALGNRSLLADPRGPDIKDQVNEIKRRQKFRPFAPVILDELAEQFFHMPPGFRHSPYMQSTAACRNPDAYPAIVHFDGTSRVQTVPDNGSGIRRLLERWYVLTGCPMLLNTSLNIRGEPMVNDRADADRFEQLYGVKVYS